MAFNARKTIENNIQVGGNGTFLIIRKTHIISTEALRQEIGKNWNYNFVTKLQSMLGLSERSQAIEVRNRLNDWICQGDQLKFPNKGDQPKTWWGCEGTPRMPW